MFEYLKPFRAIFVTGLNRSGTTIAAKMIANDTGHDLVVEDDFAYSCLPRMAAFVLADYAPVVIQCPFMSAVIHDLNYLADIDMTDKAVVFMHRPVEDIARSEKRAHRRDGGNVNFASIHVNQCQWYNASPQHVYEIKERAWQDQRQVIPNAFDVDYEELRDHPMWIEKRDFSVRQTDYDHEPGLVVEPRPMPKVIRDGVRALQIL